MVQGQTIRRRNTWNEAKQPAQVNEGPHYPYSGNSRWQWLAVAELASLAVALTARLPSRPLTYNSTDLIFRLQFKLGQLFLGLVTSHKLHYPLTLWSWKAICGRPAIVETATWDSALRLLCAAAVSANN